MDRDWDLSLRLTERYHRALSVMHHHNELKMIKVFDHGIMHYGNEKSDLPITRLNEVLGYRRSNLGQVTYRLTKGIEYGIDRIPDIVVHPMRSSWNMWEPIWVSRSRYWLLVGEVSRSCLHGSRTRRVYTLKVR